MNLAYTEVTLDRLPRNDRSASYQWTLTHIIKGVLVYIPHSEIHIQPMNLAYTTVTQDRLPRNGWSWVYMTLIKINWYDRLFSNTSKELGINEIQSSSKLEF